MDVTACMFAVSLWALAWLAHLAWWRVRVPAKQTRALLALFGAVAVGGVVAALTVPAVAAWAPAGPWGWLAAGTFHAAVSLSYVAFYSGLEEDSPTLALVLRCWRAGGELPREEAVRFLAEAPLWELRIGALVRDGFAVEDGAALRLTPKGARLARSFARAAAALGLEPDGG
jgi:hypothetical protein